MTAGAAASPLRPRRWLAFAQRGLLTQALCVAIATLLWLVDRHASWQAEWVYSTAIGTCCWLFIDGGANAVLHELRRRRPHWRFVQSGWHDRNWAVSSVVLGTAAGYGLGSRIGDWITGHATPSLLANRPALIVSALAATIATYYFYSTERLRHEAARAEDARRLAVEAQLRLLETQLEPHMLFNTLANLRVLIGLDPLQAQAMLDRLIGFLRMTLHASRQHMHPLADEFDRVADYLALMQVRMGSRLACTLDLPPALRSYPIPPLLLQPLVENAIKHGLEPKVEGGSISVRATRVGAQVMLEVCDSGVGLRAPADTHTAADTAGLRFGLGQVIARLRAVYGDGARFALEPLAGDGARARIELPGTVPPDAPGVCA